MNFKLESNFNPTGDQPKAISELEKLEIAEASIIYDRE